jgi:predicted P-loop ATPase
MEKLLSKTEFALHEKYDFKYNEVNNKLYFKAKFQKQYQTLDDYCFNSIVRELRATEATKILKKDVAELLNSSFVKKVNPFEEYFITLPEWDGTTDHIHELADTIEVSLETREFWNECFKKWIVASVACSLDSDITNHQVLIFSGAQGIGKTTWMKRLVPQRLSEYYYGGSINLGNKDTEIQLAENFLINLDELENLGRKNMSALKEIITKPSIKLRRPYGSVAETMQRRASFMGSINNLEFLTDTTGNRRFLCFEVLGIDKDHDLDLDLVYAQAYHMYMNDFKFWMDCADIQKIEVHNKNFQYVPLEQEILEKYFRPCIGNDKPDLELETEDLIEQLLSKSKLASRLSTNKLGSILSRLNWPKRKTKGRRYWLLNAA